jgi:hypothetical protein
MPLADVHHTKGHRRVTAIIIASGNEPILSPTSSARQHSENGSFPRIVAHPNVSGLPGDACRKLPSQ